MTNTTVATKRGAPADEAGRGIPPGLSEALKEFYSTSDCEIYDELLWNMFSALIISERWKEWDFEIRQNASITFADLRTFIIAVFNAKKEVAV